MNQNTIEVVAVAIESALSRQPAQRDRTGTKTSRQTEAERLVNPLYRAFLRLSEADDA